MSTTQAPAEADLAVPATPRFLQRQIAPVLLTAFIVVPALLLVLLATFGGATSGVERPDPVTYVETP